MNHKNNTVKSLIYWLLVAWVTVAIAINPEPLIRVDIELNNGNVPVTVTVTPEPVAGGQPSVGGS